MGCSAPTNHLMGPVEALSRGLESREAPKWPLYPDTVLVCSRWSTHRTIQHLAEELGYCLTLLLPGDHADETRFSRCLLKYALHVLMRQGA